MCGKRAWSLGKSWRSRESEKFDGPRAHGPGRDPRETGAPENALPRCSWTPLGVPAVLCGRLESPPSLCPHNDDDLRRDPPARRHRGDRGGRARSPNQGRGCRRATPSERYVGQAEEAGGGNDELLNEPRIQNLAFGAQDPGCSGCTDRGNGLRDVPQTGEAPCTSRRAPDRHHRRQQSERT